MRNTYQSGLTLVHVPLLCSEIPQWEWVWVLGVQPRLSARHHCPQGTFSCKCARRDWPGDVSPCARLTSLSLCLHAHQLCGSHASHQPDRRQLQSEHVLSCRQAWGVSLSECPLGVQGLPATPFGAVSGVYLGSGATPVLSTSAERHRAPVVPRAVCQGFAGSCGF